MLGGMFRGLFWPWEIPGYINANNWSLRAMNHELNSLDLFRSVPEVRTPVVFLLGRHDRHADAAVSAACFADLRAPYKQLVWFEDSAHNIPFEEPARFDATLLRELGRMPPENGGER